MNLAVKPGDDSNEEGEGEEKEEEPDEPEPEVGPPLLTPLSQDAGLSLDIFLQNLMRFHFHWGSATSPAAVNAPQAAASSSILTCKHIQKVSAK